MLRTREQIEAELNDTGNAKELHKYVTDRIMTMTDEQFTTILAANDEEAEIEEQKWVEYTSDAVKNHLPIGSIDDPENGILGHLKEHGVMI